ncbi:ABC transporter ATP-binding protein [Emergencia timonensis]|nr:oligopeptide/dipeptide ABC transporter ATP-binding protein [Emergencia timonensis]WNX87279.1 ATP-binding cassette domain-containing protein [Emergencia timonensis]
MSKEKLLEVKHLKKYFATNAGQLHAVDDVSFDINAGETLGVVGESGCGKSTLGRAVLRLNDPTAGEVLFQGENILKYNNRQMKELKKHMQLIFQDPFSSLNPRMTVSQSIALPLIIQGIIKKNDKNALNKKVEEMMDLVGLASRFVNSYPHELDGGRRQRIGIARALSLNPQFIVCDEPVSALDVSIQAQILNLMQDLQKEMGLTYLFITHDLSVVKHLANKIMVMYLGTMVEYCNVQQLFEKPLHPYTKALLSAIPVPDPDVQMERIILKGELSSPIEPEAGCRFAKRCIYATESCTGEDIPLTEYEHEHFVACVRIHEIND